MTRQERGADNRPWVFLRDSAAVLALIGSEAQQRRDIAHLIELGHVLDVEKFNVANDGVANDWVANVFNLVSGMSACRAVPDQMRIQVSAPCAFNCAGFVVFSD
jgi:hypothetical protein